MTDLVLIHGAGGNKHELTPLAEAIGPDLAYWNFNMLGHGGRPEPDVYGVEEIAEDLMRGLDQAGVGPAFFFGYSFGGLIALYLAREYPDRVLGCCMLGTKIRFDENTIRHFMHILDPARTAKMGMVEPWITAIHAKHRMLLASVDQLGGEDVVEQRMRGMTRPVLAINGNADPMVGVAETQRVVELVPNGRYAIFEGSAHPLSKVPLDVVAEQVRNFIADVEALGL
jgi:pimeloyl-ACP methyl ester carboxylesterase